MHTTHIHMHNRFCLTPPNRHPPPPVRVTCIYVSSPYMTPCLPALLPPLFRSTPSNTLLALCFFQSRFDQIERLPLPFEEEWSPSLRAAAVSAFFHHFIDILADDERSLMMAIDPSPSSPSSPPSPSSSPSPPSPSSASLSCAHRTSWRRRRTAQFLGTWYARRWGALGAHSGLESTVNTRPTWWPLHCRLPPARSQRRGTLQDNGGEGGGGTDDGRECVESGESGEGSKGGGGGGGSGGGNDSGGGAAVPLSRKEAAWNTFLHSLVRSAKFHRQASDVAAAFKGVYGDAAEMGETGEEEEEKGGNRSGSSSSSSSSSRPAILRVLVHNYLDDILGWAAAAGETRSLARAISQCSSGFL